MAAALFYTRFASSLEPCGGVGCIQFPEWCFWFPWCFFSRNGVFSSREGVFGSHKGVSGSHGVLGSRLGVLGSHQFDEAGSEKPMLYNYSWMLLRGRFLSYRWT